MNAVVTKEAPKLRLAGVVKGKLAKPVRVVLYSTDGLGKSTWAGDAPSPIFIGAEDGTAYLDVARMPDIESWRDIVESATELLTGSHVYRTVVLDTADWAEPMLWAHVAKSGGKKSIEDFAYGKGYAEALVEWRKLLSLFDRLCTEKRMNVIILAHAWIKTFKNPDAGADFDRYELKLHAKAAGLMREWADCVLFGNYETLTHEVNGRSKGIATGARILHTQRTAAFDAKNRMGLPETLALSWEAFESALVGVSAATWRERIMALLADGVTDDLRARVTKAVDAAGEDAAKLANIANHLNVTKEAK